MDTYRRTGKRKKQISLDMSVMQFFLPYWIIAFVALLLLYFVAALVYMFTSLPVSALPFISRFIAAGIIVMFSAMVGHEMKEGIVSGGFFGLVFTLAMLLLGMIMRAVSLFSLLFLILLVTGGLLGALGGVLGNGKGKRSRQRRRRVRY